MHKLIREVGFLALGVNAILGAASGLEATTERAWLGILCLLLGSLFFADGLQWSVIMRGTDGNQTGVHASKALVCWDLLALVSAAAALGLGIRALNLGSPGCYGPLAGVACFLAAYFACCWQFWIVLVKVDRTYSSLSWDRWWLGAYRDKYASLFFVAAIACAVGAILCFVGSTRHIGAFVVGAQTLLVALAYVLNVAKRAAPQPAE